MQLSPDLYVSIYFPGMSILNSQLSLLGLISGRFQTHADMNYWIIFLKKVLHEDLNAHKQLLYDLSNEELIDKKRKRVVFFRLTAVTSNEKRLL